MREQLSQRSFKRTLIEPLASSRIQAVVEHFLSPILNKTEVAIIAPQSEQLGYQPKHISHWLRPEGTSPRIDKKRLAQIGHVLGINFLKFHWWLRPYPFSNSFSRQTTKSILLASCMRACA
jgi:hypothetical protein